VRNASIERAALFVHDWAVLQQRRAPEPGAETGAQQC
jgi:hypothetical protein